MPLRLPVARCALAAPFHPCLFLAPLAGRSDIGGLLSVALSLGSPPPGVTRHRRSAEPGLSSRIQRYPRPPDPLAAGSLVVPLRLWQQQCEQDTAAFTVDHAVDQFRPEAPLEGDDRGELVAHVIAEALERDEEAGIGPHRVEQFLGRP